MEEKVLKQVFRNVYGINGEFSRVKLNDKIPIGCDCCGDCCFGTSVQISGFDIYRMIKKISPEEVIDSLSLYLGDNSHSPVASIIAHDTFCSFIKHQDGDFVCKFGDNKPIICDHPFVAIVNELSHDLFKFVPLDQEVPKFDIDDYLNNVNIHNKELIYLKNRQCKADKKDILVSDYLSNVIKYEKEKTLSDAIPLLFSKYLDSAKFIKILKLSENSSVNDLHLSDKSIDIGKIEKSLFMNAYFYFDIDSSEPFLSQTIKHIKDIENKYLRNIRILYKHLILLLDPKEVLLNKLMSMEDEEKEQEMFDEYFLRNSKIIKERFYEVSNKMVEEINSIK